MDNLHGSGSDACRDLYNAYERIYNINKNLVFNIDIPFDELREGGICNMLIMKSNSDVDSFNIRLEFVRYINECILLSTYQIIFTKLHGYVYGYDFMHHICNSDEEAQIAENNVIDAARKLGYAVVSYNEAYNNEVRCLIDQCVNTVNIWDDARHNKGNSGGLFLY